MICFDVDELTPCLKDLSTGETVETEVIRIRRKSFLSKFNRTYGEAARKIREVYDYEWTDEEL